MTRIILPVAGVMLLGASLLSGCAGKPAAPENFPDPFSATPEPSPPGGAARGLTLPQTDAQDRFLTINSGIDAQEAVWHLRAALNVAAMSCPGDPNIVKTYNRLLTERAATFATAYQGEARRHADALDRHMTQLYNFFAQPPVHAAFCQAVIVELPRTVATKANRYPAYAMEAVRRIEAPFTEFYRAYAAYQQDMAEWRARARTTRKAQGASLAKAAKSRPEPTADVWRIQIGAFAGREAAMAAWERARQRVPSLAGQKPYFEPVPGRSDVFRLQMGNAESRDAALKLCATAAAGGFDCIPVPRTGAGR